MLFKTYCLINEKEVEDAILDLQIPKFVESHYLLQVIIIRTLEEVLGKR
jgi:hypothetical protein